MFHTTVATPNKSSSPFDLTFGTPSLHNILSKWQIQKDAIGSNHCSIIIQKDTTIISIYDKMDHIDFKNNHESNFKKANWSLYTNINEKDISNRKKNQT